MKQENIEVMNSKGTRHKGGQSSVTATVSIVLLVLIALIIAAGAYLWKQQHTEIELLHEYVAKIEQQLGIKNEAVDEFRSSLSKLTFETQSQDVILNDHLRALDDDIAVMKQRVTQMESSMASQNWLLSEAEYLLKMADQRILIKEDVKGALILLRKAEKLIREMPNSDDQGLMNVRVAIAQDIASMEMYRGVDVPGTYAELAALGTAIERLPLILTEVPVESEKRGSEQGKNNTLAKVNEAFAGYITIRRHDTAELKALLSPEQRLNVRDSMRLALDQAQTALLRGDQRIYDDSLSRIRRWVLQYFIAQDVQTQQVMRRLESLAKVPVEFDLPSIAESQQELKRYLSDRMRMMH